MAPEDREEFLNRHKARLREACGIVKKQYVEAPDNVLAKTAELKKYFAASYQYAGSPRAKPTARKKAASGK